MQIKGVRHAEVSTSHAQNRLVCAQDVLLFRVQVSAFIVVEVARTQLCRSKGSGNVEVRKRS